MRGIALRVSHAVVQHGIFFLLALVLAASQAAHAGGALIGKTLTRIPGGDNYATRALVQPDGKVIVVGAVRFGTMQFQITRYNADGTLDSGFATNGTILEPLGSGDAEAWAVALQSDGKIVTAGHVRSGLDRFGIARFNTDGTLDLSFGGGGSAVSVGPGDAGAYAMAIQSDGKILLGGYSMTAASGGKKVFTVARFNADDTIDTSFGSSGFAILSAGAADEVIRSIGLQADGKIVVAGPISTGGTRLARLGANGAVDATWATTNVAYFDGGMDLVVQGDGKVAVAGTMPHGPVNDAAVLRLNANGSIDASFGDSTCPGTAEHTCVGVAHAVLGGTPPDCACTVTRGTVYGLALQSGNYLVSGDAYSNSFGGAVAVLRFNSSGTPDGTFAASAQSGLRPTGGTGDLGRGLAVRSDGRIVVAAQANGERGDYDSLVVALTANGQLDTTFNASGYSKLDVGSMKSQWRAGALQADGKVVAAGYTETESHGTPGVRGGLLARFTNDGVLDASFGSGGLAQFAWPANAVALQADGNIVVGGYALTGSPAKPSMAFGRFTAAGAADNSFGASGTFSIAPSTSDEEINAIAIQGDGRIVGAGFATGTFLDSVFVRITPAGALDTTFNGSGKLVASMSTGSDEIAAIALQPDGKIVGAGWAEISGTQDSMSVTRVNADGTVDTSFGTSGVANVNFGTATSNGYAVALQADSRIVVSGKVFSSSTSTDDFAVARLTTSGALDTSFGTNGVVGTDFGNHNRLFGMALLSNGKIVGAGETGGAYSLMQYLPNGTADTTFGAGGTVVIPMNAGADLANALLARPDSIVYYALGNASGVPGLARISGDAVERATVSMSLTSSANPASPGAFVTLTAGVTGNVGTASGTVTFLDGSTAISGCTSVTLSSGSAACTVGFAAGNHTISAQYSGDGFYSPATSNSFTQSVVNMNPARLANISTRGQVQTGNDVMIGGFVVGGPTAKTVVVRALGPSLAGNVPNPLANPTLTLVRIDGSVVAANDDWGTDANASQLSLAGFAPSNAKEAALYVTLPPGAYGAIVSGVNGGTGVALVEIYEVDHPEVPLINISTRGKVLSGDNVMIGGFVVNGSGSQTVVVRGIGPSLAGAGINGALSNPTLTLVRIDGSVIAVNDDWQSSPDAATISAKGFAPSNPLESAIYVTLPPGAYGAILSGVNGATGTGLVEVYTVQ